MEALRANVAGARGDIKEDTGSLGQLRALPDLV